MTPEVSHPQTRGGGKQQSLYAEPCLCEYSLVIGFTLLHSLNLIVPAQSF